MDSGTGRSQRAQLSFRTAFWLAQYDCLILFCLVESFEFGLVWGKESKIMRFPTKQEENPVSYRLLLFSHESWLLLKDPSLIWKSAHKYSQFICKEAPAERIGQKCDIHKPQALHRQIFTANPEFCTARPVHRTPNAMFWVTPPLWEMFLQQCTLQGTFRLQYDLPMAMSCPGSTEFCTFWCTL